MPEAEPQKEIYETPDQEDGKPALASSDRKNLEDENTTISKVAQKKERQQQKVNDEIEKMLTEAATGEDANRNDVQNLREESEHLKRRMKFGESPEQILIELAQIKKRRAREKVDEKAQAEKEKEELDINYPLLQKQIKRWDDICNKNTHLIGGGQKGADGNKAWFRQELAKNPTIKFAKQKIDEFDGTIPHPEGLAPRRKNFQELEQLCKKYSFGSPLKSAYIKENGKDEREAFLKEAKEAEEKVRLTNDQYWPTKAKNETMQEILMAKNPNEIKKLGKKIKDIHKIETDGFVHSKIPVEVNGVSVKKMSEASIALYTGGLRKEGSIKGRLDYLTGNGKYENGLMETADNELSLFQENVKLQVAKDFGIEKGLGLAGIYKDDPKGFKLAVKSFEKLDFMKKIQALKDHEKLVEKAKNKEEVEKKLKVMEAHAAIDESARKKDIATCTQKTYKEWFSDEDNYKNSKTGKPGDLETLKKFVDILTNNTVNKKSHNLAYYATGRHGFTHLLKETGKNDPKFDEATQKKWQKDYDNKGWTDKTKVYDKLKVVHKKAKDNKMKAKFLEEANDNNDTKETKEKLTLEETIASVTQLLADDQPEEAKEKLNAYVDSLPDGAPVTRTIWNLMKIAHKESKEKGEGKKLADTEEKRIEENIKTAASTDEMKDRIEEDTLITLNREAAERSENRYEKKISAQDRAQKESMSRAENQLKKDLTEDFYTQTDDKHTLNKEGTGEKMGEIKFNGVDMTDEERQKLKDDTRKHETQIFDKTGFTHIDMKDKNGKKISAEQAEVEQETPREQLENDLTNEALKKEEKQSGKNDKSAFNLNNRTTAERKAKAHLEDKETHSHERLRA